MILMSVVLVRFPSHVPDRGYSVKAFATPTHAGVGAKMLYLPLMETLKTDCVALRKRIKLHAPGLTSRDMG